MKHKLSLIARERKLLKAGLADAPAANSPSQLAPDALPSPEARLKDIIRIIHRIDRPANYMIFFVMYDIASDKVRTLVSKYLIQKGCTRVQRSIFLADLPTDTLHTIKTDLAEVQAAYDNNDSILIVPVSTSNLDAMRVIGQELNIDLITHTRNTLFF